MIYRNRAMNTGSICRNSRYASECARRSSDWPDAGRIGRTFDTDSSVASALAISRKNRSPRFRDTLAMKHSIETLHSTVSGLGGGNPGDTLGSDTTGIANPKDERLLTINRQPAAPLNKCFRGRGNAQSAAAVAGA